MLPRPERSSRKVSSFPDSGIFLARIPDQELAIAAYAVRIIGYDRTTRFCGRCGKETRQRRDERSKICDSCGLVTYPRLSPAIIVLVQRDDRLLLARSPQFPPGMFSLIAGFVEPGENLEHAVDTGSTGGDRASGSEISGISAANHGRSRIR